MFTDILTIAVLAVICTADDWDDVVVWANARHEWLKTFLALPRGIPSPETFARVFARLDPDAFERCFTAWTGDLARGMDGQVVSVDGKTLRRAASATPGTGGRSTWSAPGRGTTNWCWANWPWMTRATRLRPSPSCWTC
jgi:hypothetical protein